MSFEQESVREYARNHGHMNPEQAWILSPLDSWEKNPWYHGPAVPHPESSDSDEGYDENEIVPVRVIVNKDDPDHIPF